MQLVNNFTNIYAQICQYMTTFDQHLLSSGCQFLANILSSQFITGFQVVQQQQARKATTNLLPRLKEKKEDMSARQYQPATDSAPQDTVLERLVKKYSNTGDLGMLAPAPPHAAGTANAPAHVPRLAGDGETTRRGDGEGTGDTRRERERETATAAAAHS